MQPKWHIYWRNPGDSGLAPKFETTLPVGWTQGQTIYPRPDVFKTEHETTIGYSDRAVLFVPFEAGAGATAGETTLSVRYLICKELCIAGDGTLKLKLPSKAELGALPSFPSVVDGRSIPAPLSSVQGSATFKNGQLLIQGTYPSPVSDPPKVGFISFDHPGFSLADGPIASGTLADGHFTVTLSATQDPSLPDTQVPAIGGVVTFGGSRADPCVDFSIEVPASSAR